MTRTVDESAHSQRRHAFLDAAARLVETHGYESMTIQGVLDAVQLSKGAFYHYFNSKDALLAGLVEHLAEVAVGSLERGYDAATDRPASITLQHLLQEIGRKKFERKGLLLALTRVWYSDGNTVIRQRVESRIRTRLGCLLSRIIRQGVAEGVFETRHPDIAGRMVVLLLQDFNNILIEQSYAAGDSVDQLHVEYTVTAYNEAIERVLGAPPGSLPFLNATRALDWVVRPTEEEDAGQVRA